MGSIIQAKCSCGYETESMFVGGGISTSTTNCTFPAYCDTCKVMLQADLITKSLKCPTCYNEVVSYDEERISMNNNGYGVFSWSFSINNIERTVRLTEQKNLCPKCQQFTMGFVNLGNWD